MAYAGKDPILPWLRGIRKMKESLPPQILKEKLPRFLQKCAQTFETDRRYKNDLLVEGFCGSSGSSSPNHGGKSHWEEEFTIYQAYALYYEKVKKFEEAEKMYHLGVKNLAEPVDELHKSFEQFLHRMQCHKNKRIQRQGRRTIFRPLCNEDKENNENLCRVEGRSTGNSLKFGNIENKVVSSQSCNNEIPMKESNHNGVAVNLGNVKVSSDPSVKKGIVGDFGCKNYVKKQDSTAAVSDEPRKFSGDDTVVAKFIDTAIVGKSEAEDARHHGLVEPTINTKEAMNAINSMFREPLEPAVVGRRSPRSKPKADQSLKNGLKVFIDENLDNGVGSSNKKLEKDFLVPQHKSSEIHQPLQESLQIYIDDEENNEMKERIHDKGNFENTKVQRPTNGAIISDGHVNPFVFPNSKDLPSKSSEDLYVERPPQARFREDRVVFRFVGSAITDEPVVENVCHRGLVEPTINLREAMGDISNMFGKPIEFTRRNRRKQQEKALDGKRPRGGFLILPGDDSDHQHGKFQRSSSFKNQSDLFEPTVCTKDAMAEINKMFAMPLDFCKHGKCYLCFDIFSLNLILLVIWFMYLSCEILD